MRDAYPWRSMRFREYRNAAPGAVISLAENRPQLTAEQAGEHPACLPAGLEAV